MDPADSDRLFQTLMFVTGTAVASTTATGTAPFQDEVDVAAKLAVAGQLSRLLPQAAARATRGQ